MSTFDINALLLLIGRRQKVSAEYLEALFAEFHEVPWDRREKYLDTLHLSFNKKLSPEDQLPPWRNSRRRCPAIFARMWDRAWWCCHRAQSGPLPSNRQLQDAQTRMWTCYFVLMLFFMLIFGFFATVGQPSPEPKSVAPVPGSHGKTMSTSQASGPGRHGLGADTCQTPIAEEASEGDTIKLMRFPTIQLLGLPVSCWIGLIIVLVLLEACIRHVSEQRKHFVAVQELLDINSMEELNAQGLGRAKAQPRAKAAANVEPRQPIHSHPDFKSQPRAKAAANVELRAQPTADSKSQPRAKAAANLTGMPRPEPRTQPAAKVAPRKRCKQNGSETASNTTASAKCAEAISGLIPGSRSSRQDLVEDVVDDDSTSTDAAAETVESFEFVKVNAGKSPDDLHSLASDAVKACLSTTVVVEPPALPHMVQEQASQETHESNTAELERGGKQRAAEPDTSTHDSSPVNGKRKAGKKPQQAGREDPGLRDVSAVAGAVKSDVRQSTSADCNAVKAARASVLEDAVGTEKSPPKGAEPVKRPAADMAVQTDASFKTHWHVERGDIVTAIGPFSNGVAGYLDLRPGMRVVVQYIGTDDVADESGYLYGTLLGTASDRANGWFPAWAVSPLWDDISISQLDTGQTRGEILDVDCAICMERRRSALCLPCSHMTVCSECWGIVNMLAGVSSKAARCPLCRGAVDTVHTVIW